MVKVHGAQKVVIIKGDKKFERQRAGKDVTVHRGGERMSLAEEVRCRE